MSEPTATKEEGPREPLHLKDANGHTQFVVISAEDYALLTQTVEAARELMDVRAALKTNLVDKMGNKGGIPATVAHRIAEGENPVRVWRENRGLKAVALARAAGISPAYLSEIETGKKDGTFRTMASIARVLNVSLDDLAPPIDDYSRKERERRALIEGVRAQVRVIVNLVTGSVDFNTAAVRRAVTTLTGNAVSLKANIAEVGGDDQSDLRWLEDLLDGVRQVLDLVDHAENDIIETAARARAALEEVVTQPGFMPSADQVVHKPQDKAASAAE